MKLGEALIGQGIIDAEQLEQALNAQLIYGGTLGTCLVELCYVLEDELGDVLSRSFGVPYASGEALREVPPSVIACVPSSLVEKYSAVPFRKRDNTLDVAFADPSDVAAIDEIAFASGSRVDAWIAPEARIFQALERHYGIPRRLRYIALCRQLDAEPPGDWRVERNPGPPSPADASLRPEASVRETWSAEQADYRLSEASKRICRADTPSELADAVLSYSSGELDHGVLFRVEGNVATLWKAHGLELGRRLASSSFPVVSEPVFGLLKGRGHYAGPLPAEPQYRAFFESLGIEVPLEILLVPLHLNDRLIALFYGSRARGGAPLGDAATFRRLIQKAVLGLDMLAVQRKIRVA